MENKSIAILISAFVLIIIGVSIIVPLAEQEQIVTALSRSNEANNLSSLYCYADNEVMENNSACNITVTYAPSGWEVDDCPITEVAVKNGSTDLTEDTDYVVYDSSGVIQMLNTSETNLSGTGSGGELTIDYSYCGDNYMNSSWGRSVLDFVPGFFALAILGIGVGLVLLVLKREGLMNL